MVEVTRTASTCDALERFALYLRAAGQSPETIRLRLAVLGRFARTTDLFTASRDDLLTFIAAPGLKPSTRHSYRSTLRKFYDWAHEEGLVDSDPAAKLPSVRVDGGVPRPAPDEVVRQAIAEADDETRLMLMLGALAGLRRAEIARVHSDDVTESGLRVLGKGGKMRLVPLAPELRAALASIVGWAFPSTVYYSRPVTPDYVASRIEKALPAPWTCHTLRHRFASRAYQSTHDLRAVQTLLGHASIATTERYTQVTDQSLQEAVMAARL